MIDMKKFFILVASVIMLASCAGVTNVTSPSSLTAYPGYNPECKGKVIGTVTAQTEAVYFLGIGGLSESANADVLEILRQKANLKPNQALSYVHVVTTKKNYIFGLVQKRTLSANAVIIEFADDIDYGTPDIIDKETVVDAVPNDSKKLEQLFISHSIDECSAYEIKETSKMFYEEILHDIANEKYNVAKRKVRSFTRWYSTQWYTDEEIKSWIEDLQMRLK